MVKLVAAIITLVILIIGYIVYRYESNNRKFMEGMWTATEEYCNKSDIGGIRLYIGPELGYINSSRSGYLIMYTTDGNVLEKKIKFNFQHVGPRLDGKYVYNVEVEDLTSLEEDNEENIPFNEIMDDEMIIKLNINNGKLELWDCDEEKTFAVLYKNNSATDLSKKIKEEMGNE